MTGEVKASARVCAGTTGRDRVATQTIYATITVKRPYCRWPSNASTPTEPAGRCLCLPSDVCPKRQTIRMQHGCVKRKRASDKLQFVVLRLARFLFPAWLMTKDGDKLKFIGH